MRKTAICGTGGVRFPLNAPNIVASLVESRTKVMVVEPVQRAEIKRKTVVKIRCRNCG